MKRSIIIIIVVFCCNAAFAQKDSLALDEHGKYIYYHVAEKPGLITDTLYNRALYFLKTGWYKTEVKKPGVSGSINGSGKFFVLSGISFTKHIDGEINYDFVIECKDQKYRYWLTDFEYTPYKTDRYGNSVPELGIYIPLESGLSKLDKKQLESYLDQTGAFCVKFGTRLKQYIDKIVIAPPKDDKQKVISTKDW